MPMSVVGDTGGAEWSDEVEVLLAEWSEKSSCYRYLHNRCEKKYRMRYYCFSLPVIVLSTLSGAASVGLSTYVPEKHQQTGSAIVGCTNIFAGIISTLQQFFKFAEQNEAHRSAGISWSKLGRNICIELAIDPARRTNCHDFLSICRAEYDRLIEQSPLIGDDIIAQFNRKFKNYDADISRPSITNGLDRCVIYKRPGTDAEHELDLMRQESGENVEPEPEPEPESEVGP